MTRAALGMAGALMLAAAPAATAAGSASGQGAEPDTDYGRMMLVLDSSGSMKEKASGGQTKIEAARDALDGVIADLPDDADVGLQVFGATVFSRTDKGACADTQVVVQPGSDNRDQLSDAVTKYKPYGETPIPAALEKASASLGSEGKRSIVLVSDGESTCGNPCQVAAEIGRSGIDVQIDVVGLSVSDRARKQLECIADKGNGTYYDADDADELAESLDRISERAVRPFVVQGQPVKGTDSTSGAPEITAGVWRDRLPGEGAAVHYRIKRAIPGSTVWVGLVAQPGQTQQQAQVALTSTGDKDCGSENAYNAITGMDANDLLGVAVHSEDDEWCTDSDTLNLSVAMTEWSDGDADAPMQITVFEEPPLEGTDGLEPGVAWNSDLHWQQIEHDGDPEQVTPGSSLADAPVLESGTYDTGGVVPGEAQVFKVHLDWGESLQARAVLPVNKPGYRAYGVQAPVVRLSVLSPLGGSVLTNRIVDKYDDTLDQSVFPPTSVQQGTEYVHAMTAPVRWLNREADNPNLALPGDYYVVVTQSREFDGDSVVTPMTLEVDTIDADDDAGPAYADDAEVTGPDTGNAADRPGDASGDSAADADQDTGGSDTMKLVAGAGAIGLGAVALLAAALLGWRRRAGSRME